MELVWVNAEDLETDDGAAKEALAKIDGADGVLLVAEPRSASVSGHRLRVQNSEV